MLKKPRKIGIVSKHLGPGIIRIARDLVDYLDGKAKVQVEYELAKKLKIKNNRFDWKNIKCDLIVPIGGDGTILKTARAVNGKKIPIFGINKGVTGFMTEADADNYKQAMGKILAGKYYIEKRTKINVKLNQRDLGNALNDAVIMSANPAKVQRYRITIDKEMVDETMSDGVIVATSTGSTAYGMSAGGPILDHRLDAYEIVQICPCTISNRPLVVPAKSVTEIKVVSNRDALLVLDGFESRKITKKDIVRITRAKEKTYFAKLDKNLHQKIRRKLT